MENRVIADMLDEIAAMLSIEETKTTRFEVRAYKNAALTLMSIQEPIENVYRRGGVKAIMEFPGIGPGIAGKIEEFIRTGHMKKYDELKRRYPIDFKGLLSLEGMGAKKAVTLYKRLGIRNLQDLKGAIDSHRISSIEGFGSKSEEMFSKSMRIRESSKGRILLGVGLPAAEAIVRALQESGTVSKAVIAGSTRRMKETVGDLDILAISKTPEKAMDVFTSMKDVTGVVSRGSTRSTVSLNIGVTCDLRVLPQESFGAALQYFIGNKQHNIETRTIAIKKGYKLNEYGLFTRDGRMIASDDERDIYAKLGMQYVPPEMREARGEIQLALHHKIPTLVEMSDLKGDLHTHTRETDGANTIEEMADAAQKTGFSYIATTNHTQSLRIAKGMSDRQFAAFDKKVDRLNDSLKGFRVLKGAECDILKDGSLDLSKETLRSMECVVGSVHASFRMPEREMTDRVVKAIGSGLIHILGHPTGRLINEREGFAMDLGRVAQACEDNGVALEINSWPNRLDLNDTNILLASKYKVRFSINSDAHSTAHYQMLRYGVGTARRGWLTPDRVLNTLPTDRLLKAIKR